MIRVAAGIVTYNPDINLLQQNVDAICDQVDQIYIIDNGSKNQNEIAAFSKTMSIKIIKNADNQGMARALNQLLNAAEGYQWIYTLDQDSVTRANTIYKLLKYATYENVGMITSLYSDRSAGRIVMPGSEKVEFIDQCITSGCLTNIDICKSIGGFDEKLFIDLVDFEMCMRLRKNGYKILQVNFDGFIHEIGNKTTKHTLMGKKFYCFNHSASRCYYIIRNNIYVSRKHADLLGKAESFAMKKRSWTRIIVYLLFEDEKQKKLKAWSKGIVDGYKMPMN